MSSDPVTAASREARLLSALTRQELADLWVETLREASARVGNSGRGRGGHWAVAGRDPELRRVEREFIRRLQEEEELRHAFLELVATWQGFDQGPETYR